MNGLVLSLFSGLGVLDLGFELEGFCVVRGPEVLSGGDVRSFHPIPGRFDGVIGGPPCQEWSGFGNLVKLRTGQRSRYGNLIPEFERCVLEAEPSWWVMENIPAAPIPIGGVSVVLSNRDLGEVQHRERRFTFGGLPRIEAHLPKKRPHVSEYEPPVTGAHPCSRRPKGGHGERRSIGRMLELQGLPATYLDEAPFTMEAKRKLVGNAVPLSMARAIARAVRDVLR